MRARYGLEENADAALLKLQGMKQGSKDIEVFADEIWDCAFEAFPNTSQEEKERQAVNHFIWGLKDHTGRGIMACQKPTTMQQAVRIAVSYQHANKAAEFQNEKPKEIKMLDHVKQLQLQETEYEGIPVVRALPQADKQNSKLLKLESGIDSLARAMSNLTRGQMEQTKIMKSIQESLAYRRPNQYRNNYGDSARQPRQFRGDQNQRSFRDPKSFGNQGGRFNKEGRPEQQNKPPQARKIEIEEAELFSEEEDFGVEDIEVYPEVHSPNF